MLLTCVQWFLSLAKHFHLHISCSHAMHAVWISLAHVYFNWSFSVNVWPIRFGTALSSLCCFASWFAFDFACVEMFRPYSPSFQEFGKQAVESARFKEQVTDTPQYRPFTNPNLQSNSFKTLQNVVDSGQGKIWFYVYNSNGLSVGWHELCWSWN